MKNNRKRILYIIVIVLVIASISFRVINDLNFEQTALLFVGLPALITVLLIKYSKTPKSIYGIVFKTITLFLLMSAILFGEGLVCIIFMAPIFYGIAALIIWATQFTKKRDKSKLNIFIIFPLILICSQFYEINPEPEIHTVETSVVVSGNTNLKQLKQLPDFMKDFPAFFKIGFPKPISISGTGIEVGDSRKIQFKSNTKGIGTLHLKVKEKNDNTITFEIIEDSTHMHHWLTWKEITVSVEPHQDGTSKIVWTTKFTCDLGPKWYFLPLEKYGVRVMNQHLINSFFK